MPARDLIVITDDMTAEQLREAGRRLYDRLTARWLVDSVDQPEPPDQD